MAYGNQLSYDRGGFELTLPLVKPQQHKFIYNRPINVEDVYWGGDNEAIRTYKYAGKTIAEGAAIAADAFSKTIIPSEKEKQLMATSCAQLQKEILKADPDFLKTNDNDGYLTLFLKGAGSGALGELKGIAVTAMGLFQLANTLRPTRDKGFASTAKGLCDMGNGIMEIVQNPSKMTENIKKVWEVDPSQGIGYAAETIAEALFFVNGAKQAVNKGCSSVKDISTKAGNAVRNGGNALNEGVSRMALATADGQILPYQTQTLSFANPFAALVENSITGVGEAGVIAGIYGTPPVVLKAAQLTGAEQTAADSPEVPSQNPKKGEDHKIQTSGNPENKPKPEVKPTEKSTTKIKGSLDKDNPFNNAKKNAIEQSLDYSDVDSMETALSAMEDPSLADKIRATGDLYSVEELDAIEKCAKTNMYPVDDVIRYRGSFERLGINKKGVETFSQGKCAHSLKDYVEKHLSFSKQGVSDLAQATKNVDHLIAQEGAAIPKGGMLYRGVLNENEIARLFNLWDKKLHNPNFRPIYQPNKLTSTTTSIDYLTNGNYAGKCIMKISNPTGTSTKILDVNSAYQKLGIGNNPHMYQYEQLLPSNVQFEIIGMEFENNIPVFNVKIL